MDALATELVALESYTESLEALWGEYRGEGGLSLVVSAEALDERRKGLVARIWDFIKRIAASILRVLGLAGETVESLRDDLDKISRRLAQHKGKSAKGVFIPVGHYGNHLIVGNKLPQTASEYNTHLMRLEDTLRVVLKTHIPAVKATGKALQSAYATKPSDRLVMLNTVTKAALTISLERLTGPLQCKSTTSDPRFARSRPVYKGPDLLGNRSVFIDIPYQTMTGVVSDYDRARRVSESRISYITSSQRVSRIEKDASVRPMAQSDLMTMIERCRKVLDVIESYPKDLDSEYVALERTWGNLSSDMASYDGPRNEQQYQEVAASILTAYSTWMANPHTPLVSASLTSIRAMISMINAQRKAME